MNSDITLIFERYKSSIEESLDTGTMTVDELKDYLLSIKRACPVSVDMEAPARMTKTGNPYLGTIKKSTINGMAGGDYGLGVGTQELRAHEDDPNYQLQFKAEPLWGGKGERISPLVAYHKEKNEYYLVIGTPKSGRSEYIFQGAPIDVAKLDQWLIKSAPSVKQMSVGIEADKTIQPRMVTLKNIKHIRINNVDLQII